MFNFFENLSEIINAVSIHRLWLYGLSAAVIFLVWALYKTHVKINELKDDLEYERIYKDKKESKKDKKESFFHDNLF